jgi:LacI family transcriptional regulator
MRVTMKDVAEAANVSVSTVSLVLNGVPGITESTREHVKAVMRRLNYTPNAQARRLASGQTHAVALVLPPWQATFADPYFLELMRGTLEAVRDRGYQMLLEVADERFMENHLWSDLFTAKKVDGLIIATPYLDQGYLGKVAEQGHPAMLINGERSDLPELDYVGYHDVRCGIDATNYLLGLGHRRIGHIAGSANQASAVHRLTGYRHAIGQAGLAFRDDYVVNGDYMPLEARDALDRILALPRDQWPTAFFCANDTMAISVMTHLRELGHQVPRDFSVVGVDDTGAAAQAVPALTTFRQDIFELARQGAALFLEKLQKNAVKEPIRERIPMQLVERASCVPPAAG